MARLRARPAATRPLSDFTFTERFSMVSNWMPTGQYPTPPATWAVCRWTSWDEYLRDYASVEAEIRQHFPRLTRIPFAECARRYRDQHGAAALSTATYADLRGVDGGPA